MPVHGDCLPWCLISGRHEDYDIPQFLPVPAGQVSARGRHRPGFEAIEEAEARDVTTQARDSMLARSRQPDLNRDDSLSRAVQYVAGQVTETTFDELFSRLSFFSTDLKRLKNRIEKTLDPALELDALIASALGVPAGLREAGIIEETCRDDQMPLQTLRAMLPVLQKGNVTEKKMAASIQPFLTVPAAERASLFPDYVSAFLTQKWEITSRFLSKRTQQEYPDEAPIFFEEQQRLYLAAQGIKKARVLKATWSVLTLVITQLDIYDQVKSQQGLLDFDDMILKTSSLLSRGAIAPWILYKLDDKIDHILVDEAQDTNAIQWQVIETLAAEFFAGSGAREETRTVFAVGDAKQSIYSFQKADPSQFLAARDRLFNRVRAADHYADTIPLTLSFRSGQAVLSLVDSTFAEESVSAGVSLDGSQIEHDYIRSGAGGHVELWPLEEPAPPADTEDDWRPPVHQETADDAEERLAGKVATKIREIITTGVYIPAKNRLARAEDILVLVRKRTAFVDYLVKRLKAEGIAVTGKDRMGAAI